MMNAKIHYNRENEKGFALVTALIFLVVMGVLSTALVFSVQNEMRTSASYRYNREAFHVANAGVQKAVNWFRHTYEPLTSTTGASNYDRTQNPITNSANGEAIILSGPEVGDSNFPEAVEDMDYISSYLGSLSSQPLAADDDNFGTYDVHAELVRYKPATFIDLVNGFKAKNSAIERWVITSTGYWGNPAKPMGIAKIEAIIENAGNCLFDRGLWGIEGLIGNGGVIVDSFDPAKGLWNQATNNGNNGSVGSNINVTSNGNIEVHGDVAYGPAGSFTINGGSGIVTGNAYKLPEPRYFPPLPNFDVGSGNQIVGVSTELDPGKYGNVRINNGDVLKLSGGEYYFDEISMTGGAIEVSAPCTIYVKSDLDIAGQGIIHPAGVDPQDVKILYSGTRGASIAGGSEAFIELYAPNAAVTLGGDGEHHGSFIGKTLTIGGNAHIHFNEGKDQNNLIHRPFRILSWSQKAS